MNTRGIYPFIFSFYSFKFFLRLISNYLLKNFMKFSFIEEPICEIKPALLRMKKGYEPETYHCRNM